MEYSDKHLMGGLPGAVLDTEDDGPDGGMILRGKSVV